MDNVTISLNKYELAFIYSLLRERKDINNIILNRLQVNIHNLILKDYLSDEGEKTNNDD